MHPHANGYHALLIGIDAYPEGSVSLYGGVNDVNLIERLVVETAGSVLPVGRLLINKLLAPHNQMDASSESIPLLPTRSHIVEAMLQMAEAAQVGDRALIYYSGHGDYLRWKGAPTLHEAIVPCDMEFLYDVEVNALLNLVARAFNGDLTVVFDCCYSAGVFRDPQSKTGNAGDMLGVRALSAVKGSPQQARLGQAPDFSLMRSLSAARGSRATNGMSSFMLRGHETNYIAISACQAVERARERPLDGAGYHGLLTYALATHIEEVPLTYRPQLRWSDIWSRLIRQVETLNHFAPFSPQHPWLVGRRERHIFGGQFDLQDAGFSLEALPNGTYRVGAGSLMGVTPGAEIAVYGSKPLQFSPLGTGEDEGPQFGSLIVTSGDQIESSARALTTAEFILPLAGGRGRLTKAAAPERLRVLLTPPDPLVAAYLERDALFSVRAATEGDAEVRVAGSTVLGWRIEDPMVGEIAYVPPGALQALKAGLTQYSLFNSVLRLPDLISPLGNIDPLEVKLLDCNDLNNMNAQGDSNNPDLKSLEGVSSGSYVLPAGTRFCISFRNTYTQPLFVNIFNCEAYGIVDHMGDLAVRPGEQQVLWNAYRPYHPWHLRPSRRSQETPSNCTDRFIILATTRPAVEVSKLATKYTVQKMVDLALDPYRSAGRTNLHKRPGSVPPDVWFAQTISVLIEVSH